MDSRLWNMIAFSAIYTIFGLLLYFAYKKFSKPTRKIQKIDIFIIAVLVIVSAIRLNTGSDFYSYYLRYNGITDSYASIFDVITKSNAPLFDAISYVMKSITRQPYAIFYITSALFYIPLIVFLRKNNDKPYNSLFIFIMSTYFMATNNILRHTMAMLILFYAYNGCLKKGKLVKYILFTLLASLCHTTVIIVAIILIVGKYVKGSKKKLLVSNIIGLMLYALHGVIFAIIPDIVGEKYSEYVNPEYSEMIKQSLAVIGYIIFYNIISYMLIKYSDKIRQVNKDIDTIIGAILIALPISWLAISAWPINRISMYVYFFTIQYVPMAMNYINAKQRHLLQAAYIAWSIFAIIMCGDNEYYHYDTQMNTEIRPMSPSFYVDNYVRV